MFEIYVQILFYVQLTKVLAITKLAAAMTAIGIVDFESRFLASSVTDGSDFESLLLSPD